MEGSIIVPYNEDLQLSLIEKNFKERTGSPSYHRPNLLIDFKRKYFWKTNDKCKIL